MAVTTTSTMDNVLLSKALESQIIEYARDYLFMPSLMKVYDLSDKNSKTISVPKWGGVSAAALTEGTDMTATTMSDTNVDISVGEVGVRVDVTDLSNRTSVVTLDDYAAQCAEAVAEKIDSDAIGLFNGFSQVVGSTGTDFTLDTLLDGLYKLEASKGRGRVACVLHPRQINTLRKLFAGTAGSTATYYTNNSPDLGRKPSPLVASWMNVDFYSSNLVPKINTNADFCGAMFLIEKALGMASLWNIQVELQRDASARLTEINVTSCYGVGELVDAYGVQIVSKVA